MPTEAPELPADVTNLGAWISFGLIMLSIAMSIWWMVRFFVLRPIFFRAWVPQISPYFAIWPLTVAIDYPNRLSNRKFGVEQHPSLAFVETNITLLFPPLAVSILISFGAAVLLVKLTRWLTGVANRAAEPEGDEVDTTTAPSMQMSAHRYGGDNNSHNASELGSIVFGSTELVARWYTLLQDDDEGRSWPSMQTGLPMPNGHTQTVNNPPMDGARPGRANVGRSADGYTGTYGKVSKWSVNYSPAYPKWASVSAQFYCFRVTIPRVLCLSWRKSQRFGQDVTLAKPTQYLASVWWLAIRLLAYHMTLFVFLSILNLVDIIPIAAHGAIIVSRIDEDVKRVAFAIFNFITLAMYALVGFNDTRAVRPSWTNILSR
jgi:hypothetical protein